MSFSFGLSSQFQFCIHGIKHVCSLAIISLSTSFYIFLDGHSALHLSLSQPKVFLSVEALEIATFTGRSLSNPLLLPSSLVGWYTVPLTSSFKAFEVDEQAAACLVVL
jgi:hypothetical protein